MTVLARQPVADLIPHRPPMQLLSQVLAASDEQIWAVIRLEQTSPFATAAGVPSNIALEYLAQTAAAFFSVHALKTSAPLASSAPRQGMLIGCSTLTCACPFFACPGTLLAQASLASGLPKDSQVGGLVRFDGQLSAVDSNVALPTAVGALSTAMRKTPVLASGSLSVFLPPLASE